MKSLRFMHLTLSVKNVMIYLNNYVERYIFTMKKIILLILALTCLVLTLLFTSCDCGSESSSSATQTNCKHEFSDLK